MTSARSSVFWALTDFLTYCAAFVWDRDLQPSTPKEPSLNYSKLLLFFIFLNITNINIYYIYDNDENLLIKTVAPGPRASVNDCKIQSDLPAPPP